MRIFCLLLDVCETPPSLNFLEHRSGWTMIRLIDVAEFEHEPKRSHRHLRDDLEYSTNLKKS